MRNRPDPAAIAAANRRQEADENAFSLSLIQDQPWMFATAVSVATRLEGTRREHIPEVRPRDKWENMGARIALGTVASEASRNFCHSLEVDPDSFRGRELQSLVTYAANGTWDPRQPNGRTRNNVQGRFVPHINAYQIEEEAGHWTTVWSAKDGLHGTDWDCDVMNSLSEYQKDEE